MTDTHALSTPDATTPEAVAAAAAAAAAGNPPPFYETFKDPAVKDLMVAKKYDSPDALGLAYLNLSKLQRGATDVIALPAPTDAEGIAKVHAALGRPEKPEAYEFKFGDGVAVDPKLETFAKGLFHGLGASPAAAQDAADKWNAFTKEMTEAHNAEVATANTKAVETLKGEWKGDWDANVAAGQKAVAALGLTNDELKSLDDAAGLATVMKLFATIGKKMGSERVVVDGGGGGGPQSINSPEQARTEINRLKADKAFQDILFTPTHPERADKVAHWNKLHEIANRKS